jgi:hypothetical protein
MNDENPTFKSGDKVRIKRLTAFQFGEVIGTLGLDTTKGPCELVWVKLVEGKVDGFSPCNLEKLRALPRRQAA